jgi:hypothetical protein
MALKDNCLKKMLIQILQNCRNASNRICVYSDPDPDTGAARCLAVDAKADPELLHDHLVEKHRVHEHEDPRAPVQDHEDVRKLL